jgi:hypothetical protein
MDWGKRAGKCKVEFLQTEQADSLWIWIKLGRDKMMTMYMRKSNRSMQFIVEKILIIYFSIVLFITFFIFLSRLKKSINFTHFSLWIYHLNLIPIFIIFVFDLLKFNLAKKDRCLFLMLTDLDVKRSTTFSLPLAAVILAQFLLPDSWTFRIYCSTH